jgi:hypothetical protein
MLGKLTNRYITDVVIESLSKRFGHGFCRLVIGVSKARGRRLSRQDHGISRWPMDAMMETNGRFCTSKT